MLQTPKGGAGHGIALTDSRLMSIGTVLNVLRDEFPEVTISKIRFLESEGLIEPQRTPSGYRKFSPDDVERLAHVLRMQRDHYLPLKVIKEQLDALERGEAITLPSAGRPGDGEDGRAQEGGDGPTVARVGREELLAAAGIESPSSTSGSRTASSRRCPTADTTRRRSRSPGWSWNWAASGSSRGICGR